MKKQLKKALATILAVIMIFASAPFIIAEMSDFVSTASAAETTFFTVYFHANGGTNAPTRWNFTPSGGVATAIITEKIPEKYCYVTFDMPDSQADITDTYISDFKYWTTSPDGTGKIYEPGKTYTITSSVNLYAQWEDRTIRELPTPTRNGYIFDGWYTAESGGLPVTYGTPVTSGMTVYPHWIAEIEEFYNLSYDANGGWGAPDNQIFSNNNNVVTVSSETPYNSYIIWYVNEGKENSFFYECTFNNWNTNRDGSGTVVEPGKQYRLNNSLIVYAQWINPVVSALPTPSRDGYIFDGWYTSKSGGTKVNPGFTLTKDTYLYAHWTEEPTVYYSLTYYANGGSGAPENQVFTNKENSVTISSKIPTKSYTVKFNANGSETSKTYNCTFNNWNTSSGGNGTEYKPSVTYRATDSFVLYAQWKNTSFGTLPVPTRDGYTFDGWYTSQTGGREITSSTIVDGNITLYARWTKNPVPTYTVYYNANGGSGVPSNQVKTKDIVLTLSSVVPTKSYNISLNANGGSVSQRSISVSCNFLGWNTDIDGTGEYYQPGSFYGNNSAVTLYAQWDIPTAGNLPEPTNGNHRFKGWFTAPTGGTKITNSTEITANITVYAQWMDEGYLISYDANGGINAPESHIKKEGITAYISNDIPSMEFTVTYYANGGFVSPSGKNVYAEFNRWNTQNNGNGISYVPGEKYISDYDVTLYAQWDLPTFGALPTPTYEGYIFDGWYTSASGGELVEATDIVTSDITVYAHWTRKTAPVDPDPIPDPDPTIEIDKTQISMNYKDSSKVNATASDGRKIVYKSSDTSVATVDGNGNISAVGTGNATITATIEGTNISATCSVSVSYSAIQWIIIIFLLGFLWY